MSDHMQIYRTASYLSLSDKFIHIMSDDDPVALQQPQPRTDSHQPGKSLIHYIIRTVHQFLQHGGTIERGGALAR